MNTLLTLLATICLASNSGIQEENAEETDVYRVAVMGASASAGYGVVVEVEQDGNRKKTGVNLTDIFQAACDHEEIVFLDLSSGLFFLRPISYAQAAVTRAKIWRADLVLGIDFLFWCLYGNDDGKGGRLESEAQRLDKLEMGLKILDELEVPVIVGDIPDMTQIGGYLLSKSQRPTQENVQKANKRIHEWASTRPNVEVVGLHDFIVHVHARESFEIGPHSWDIANEDIEIIGQDQLHPSLDGLIALAQALNEGARGSQEVQTALPPLNLARETIYTRLRRGKKSPRRAYFRSAHLGCSLRRARSPWRSLSLSAASSARVIAARR